MKSINGLAPGMNRRAFLQRTTSGGLAFALGGSGIARAQGKAPEPIQLFIGSNPAWGNLMVGVEKGFFKKAGVTVDITYFASGATAVDAFRAGRGHLVGAGDLPSLRLWQQGGIGICPQANYGDLSVVVAKKSVTKPSDLRGKKVGVLLGGTVEYFAKLYLASGGVDTKDVEMVNLRPMEMVTGFVRGDIDAFVIFQPFGWRATQADSNAHIVTTAAPFFREWLVVNATPEYAKNHGEELVAFLKGLDEAGKWITGNMDEATQIVAKSLRMDDVATVKMMLETVDWSIAYTKKFRSDMEKIAQFFQVPLDWTKSFDSRHLARLGPAFVEA
jgi:ABC-type nitrate/sulfonate/bicarbonate transport system substrate-binding protein